MHDDDDFPGHIHDYDMALQPGETEEDVEGIEMFKLRSVGIDIGSSTSHLVFSQLTLRRQGTDLSTQFKVTEREVLYRSPIMLTPYLTPTLIDLDKLTAFFHAAYGSAGMTPDEVDTGAVVITGEALNKENARPITEFFAKDSGKFICASAGPNHEALLAAHGCGAVALSEERHATVLNVDCGGGTSKLSLIKDGTVTSTAAISVGARLIAMDADNRVNRIEEPAHAYMKDIGRSVALGQVLTAEDCAAFADRMAGVLFEAVTGNFTTDLARSLLVTDIPLSGYAGLDSVDYIVFSGGVSEYVYQRDTIAYGDMGPLLGASIRSRLTGIGPKPSLMLPAEGIRATVIGAGEYTVQASGVTSYLSSVKPLPSFGLQVVRARIDSQESVEASIQTALRKFDLDRFSPGLAIALDITGPLNYQSLRSVAEGIAKMLEKAANPDDPLFLLLDLDVAKSLGGILKEELGVQRELIALDGIELGDLDYIDIGRPMGFSESVTVIVKSMMFPHG